MDERELTPESKSQARWQHGNIVLTGATGSGKSTIGRQLAQLLGLGFVDMDKLVETAAGKKISAIFATDGEPVFREFEERILRSLLDARGQVIAVGGGALVSDSAMNTARTIGPVVWVQSSPAEIARRMFRRVQEMESRPMFKDLVAVESHEQRRDMIQERVRKLMDERRPWYSRSDVVLDGSYVTPEMAAQHLKDILITEGLIGSGQDRFATWHRRGE